MLSFFENEENLIGLRENAGEVLERAFEFSHHQVKQAFRQQSEEEGWNVEEMEGGYLVKSRILRGKQCIHGGTTASIAVILNNRYLVCAHVGDSDLMLGGIIPNVMQSTFSLDQVNPTEIASRTGAEVSTYKALNLTADHSALNPNEYRRVRETRPDPNNPGKPELKFVYDTPNHQKVFLSPFPSLLRQWTHFFFFFFFKFQFSPFVQMYLLRQKAVIF